MESFQCALNRNLLLESEKGKMYFAFDTTELLKGDMLKRYQAYQIALQSNFMQIDEVRYKEDLPKLGFNYVKLGLQDVLLDVKSGTVYTPNTNQTAKIGSEVLKNGVDSGIIETKEETRFNPYHDPTNGRFTSMTNSTSGIDNMAKNDIINTGAISGALNPYSAEAAEHAERYYESVRHMTTDVAKIAKNTGLSEDEIAQIKNHVFVEKHDLGGSEPEYFLPSYEMAQSWQRLIEGKNIQKHDITLLKHENMEQRLMKQGYSQKEAHKITEQKYNYSKECKEYYADVSEHNKK